MRAVVFDGSSPVLDLRELPGRLPSADDLLINVHACGVCRTDLPMVDGELTQPKRPVIPGHEVIGTVAAVGDNVTGFRLGDRVGIPRLGRTCGVCRHCASGREKLCD